jgi:cobalt-zinc-cadmium efflux system membrane fusion protein
MTQNIFHYVILLIFYSGYVVAQDAHNQGLAVVTGHPDETLVNTITLTEQAVSRLGIETTAVRTDRIANSRLFGGTIIEPSGDNIQIVSPYDAVVLPVNGDKLPNAGTKLTRSESILNLSVLPVAQQMQGAKEVLEAKLTELEIARTRVQRAEQLLKDGSGSLRDLENARQALADSEAAYKAAEIGGTLAISGSTNNSTNLSSITVTAPKDALIKDIFVTSGQIVRAGDLLVTLSSTGLAWVRVPIFTGYLTRYSRDVPAQVQNLGNPVSASVPARFIEGPLTAEPSSSSIDLYMELDNSDRRFRPGERVSVQLTETSSNDRLLVPDSAIFRDIHGGTWVYVAHDKGVYTRERVEVERTIDDIAVLRTGPQVGTMVVTVAVAELAGTEFGVAH